MKKVREVMAQADWEIRDVIRAVLDDDEGMTRAELASAIGISTPQLSRLLNRASPSAKVQTVLRLAQVIGVDPRPLVEANAIAQAKHLGAEVGEVSPAGWSTARRTLIPIYHEIRVPLEVQAGEEVIEESASVIEVPQSRLPTPNGNLFVRADQDNMQGCDHRDHCIPAGSTVEVRPSGWMGVASGDVVLAQVGVNYACFYQVEIRYKEGRRKAELVSTKRAEPPVEGVKPIEEGGETRILGVACRVVDLSLNKG